VVSTLAQRASPWRWLTVGAALIVWGGLLAMAVVPEWRAEVAARSRWTLEPMFHDWHVVRLGWQANAQGVDPLANPDMPYNYPRFVLLGGKLGGAAIPPVVAGLALAAAFLFVAVRVLKPRSPVEWVAAAALVASPPVWLLLERGNLDALTFIILAPGLWFLARRTPGPLALVAGSVALFAAAAIKLYPAVILVAAIFFWRGARVKWSVVLAVGFAGWLVASLDEVALVLQKTTRGLEPAYGRVITGSRWVSERVTPHVSAEEAQATLQALMRVSLVTWLLGAALALAAGWRLRGRFAKVAGETRDRAFFWSGALIYGGTFLLGHNWSYRLVFLLLCVPFLWQARRVVALRVWATAALAGVGVMLLAPFHLPIGWFLAHQAVAWTTSWLLLAGAAALLAVGNDAAASSKAG
jgi:hypothetical protein